MDVSSRDSLDIACISPISTDLMLCRWAFRAELDSPPPAKSPEITWFPQGVAGAELSSVKAMMVAVEPEFGSEYDSEAGFLGI